MEYFNQLELDVKKEILIKELLNDTKKFSKEDLYHGIGTYNRNAYSPLYIINGKQFFKN